MKDLNTLLDRLMSSLDAIAQRLDVVEQSVNDSLTRATKTERAMCGEPQPTKRRPLAPASKGSLAAKSLGLG